MLLAFFGDFLFSSFFFTFLLLSSASAFVCILYSSLSLSLFLSHSSSLQLEYMQYIMLSGKRETKKETKKNRKQRETLEGKRSIL